MHSSFEKEVQKKLEEMEFIPSAPVWENVEMEKKKKKNTRPGFFWLPATLLLLTGSAGWWIYHTNHQQNNQANGATTVAQWPENKPASPLTQPSTPLSKSTTPITIDTITQADTIVATSVAGHHSNTINLYERNKKHLATGNQLSIVESTAPKMKLVHSNKQRKPAATTPITTFKNRAANKQNLPSNHTNQPATVPVSQEVSSSQVNEKPITTKNSTPLNSVKDIEVKDREIRQDEEPLIKTFKKDSLVNALPAPIAPLKDSALKPASTDSVVIKIKVAKQNKKWQGQLLFAGGSANYANASRVSPSARADQASLTVPFSTYDYIGGNIPSQTLPGLTTSIGYGVSKAITKKLTFKAGLQYAYYSFKQKTSGLIAYTPSNSSANGRTILDIAGQPVNSYYAPKPANFNSNNSGPIAPIPSVPTNSLATVTETKIYRSKSLFFSSHIIA